MIQFGNGVAADEMWERARNKQLVTVISGQEQTVNEMILQARSGHRLVWYWYWVDGKILASSYKAKLYDAKAKLLGGRLDSAVVALSIPVDTDMRNHQRNRLSEIAARLPSLETIVKTGD